jgi:hypothetical protein
MSKKSESIVAPESKQNNRGVEQKQSPEESTAVPIEITARWERLKKHHEAAGQAFLHSVIAGLEIVRLKLVVHHGAFCKQALEHVPGIAPRTIRRYRQLGEWYLSAAHERVVTVAELREAESEPQDHLCTDEAVAEYLEAAKIHNADELHDNAVEKVPDLAEPRSNRNGSRVENIMGKIKRAWSRMTGEQRTEFIQCFDAFRAKPPKPPKTQSTGVSQQAEMPKVDGS